MLCIRVANRIKGVANRIKGVANLILSDVHPAIGRRDDDMPFFTCISFKSMTSQNLRADANAPTPISGSRALLVLRIFDPVRVDAFGVLKVSTLWATTSN